MFSKSKNGMGRRLITSLVVGFILVLAYAPSAFAAHQDHAGACGTTTSSISKTIKDWQYLGVLNKVASLLGINGHDGPLKYQMEQHLVIGKVRGTVTSDNHECNGGGTYGGAGTKTLSNLEEVMFKPSPSIGKEACKKPSSKCEKKAGFAANGVVFPLGCKNPNEKHRTPVWVWVRKHERHEREKPHQRRFTLFVKKVAKDSSGNRIPTPTGTFRFKVTASGHSKVVTLKHNPEYIGNYFAGTNVKVHEVKPLGPDDWETVSKATQTIKVTSRYTFTFVDKEKGVELPPLSPPPSPAPECAVNEVKNALGVCVKQSNTAEQNCSVMGGTWNNSNMCTIIQVNANCSTVTIVNGSGNVVETYNEGNCNVDNPPPPPPTCQETGTCPVAEPLKVEWERIQEVYINKTRRLCVTASPTSVVSSVQFGVKWGERSNGGVGVYNASINKYCVQYTAPSEEPPHVCEEEIATKLPPGTKCDIANVAVTSNNGAKTVTGKMEIPILDAEANEEIVW